MSLLMGNLPGATSTMDAGITPLESHTNFSSWSRDIQAVAQFKGLWPYLAGTKTLVEVEPTREAEADTDKGYNLYRGKLQDFEKQGEKIAATFHLLHLSVAPSIRRSLLGFTNPAEAFESIKTQFQPSDYRVRHMAYNKMESIKLTRDKKMPQFIEELKTCRQDIIDAKGEYSEEQLVHKIARSLPKDYDDFVHTNIQLVDEPPKLDDITNKLFALEPRVLERQKTSAKAGNNTQTNSNGTGDGNSGRGGKGRGSGRGRQSKPSDKTCSGCNREGHTYEECRSTNPVVQAKIIEASTKVKQEKDSDNKPPTYSSAVKQGVGAVAVAPTDVRKRFAAIVFADLSAIQAKRAELAQSRVEGSPDTVAV